MLFSNTFSCQYCTFGVWLETNVKEISQISLQNSLKLQTQKNKQTNKNHKISFNTSKVIFSALEL